MVRAKFKVEAISSQSEGSVSSITLRAVTNGSEENKMFFKYTPAGYISLGTTNPEVANQFEPNGEFYVDFTKVEKND